MSLKWGRLGAGIALFGAAMGVLADELLLYSPTGGYEDPAMGFMALISQERLYWGALLGVLAIPLEGAGLLLVYRALLPSGKRFAGIATGLGAYVIAIGTATHACFFYVGYLAGEGKLQEAMDLLTPIAGTMVLGFFLLFLGLAALIARGKTTLPRWMALCTPISVYFLSLLAYLLLPAAGNFLLPAGFNLGMFVFFALLLNQSK